MTHPASEHDPMGWQYELQWALEDPALAAFERPDNPGPEAMAAAYRLALCLGYCRLLGIDLPDDIDGILPAREAMAAAEELIRHLGVWVEEAQQLPDRWDSAPAGVEDAYCTDILEARNDAWAACWAISEAYEDCVVHGEETGKEFDGVIDRVSDALDRFDAVLQQPEILSLLSTVAGTPLLNNWRKMFRITESGYVPWWLDGTLEEESRRIEAEVTAFANQWPAPRPVSMALQYSPSIARRHPAAAIENVQVTAALAAAPNDEEPPIPVILQWASPDGRWTARLSCPNRMDPGDRFPLEFLSTDDQPAADLAGQSVWLAGQREQIDEKGVARFDVLQLKTAVADPKQLFTLEVGEGRTEWPAIQSYAIEERLHQWCAGAVEDLPPPRAYEVAARLKNLAVWWLRPEVLKRAAERARQLGLQKVSERWEREPLLPIKPGACWIAVVNKRREELGLLRPAYALPLCWAPKREHDPRLPQGLRELADKVHRELQDLGEVSEPWGLLPGSDEILCGVDLSKLDGQWDSGWAPLAVGLLLAAWEGKADAKVWASGSWEPSSGIQPVDDLEPKAELALSHGAGWFFVPESKAEALREWAQSQCLRLKIGTLRQNTRDLREALGEYLERLEMPIGPGAHLKDKRAEHFRRIQDDKTAKRFYRKYILLSPDVVENLRQGLPSKLLSGDKKLITVVSKGFDLVRLAVEVIQPTACLLLHDEELANQAFDAQDWILRERPDCRVTTSLLEQSTGQRLLNAFRSKIKEFAPEARPDELVFDLTAGKKIMSAALYDAAPVGSYVICIEADQDDERRRPIPYTERLHVWQVAPKPAA